MKQSVVNQIVDLVKDNRSKGNTSFILRSAVKNPNVIIISPTHQHAVMLKEYYEYWYIHDTNRIIRWFHKIKGRQHASFSSLGMDLKGNNKPIVFDNSCFPNE